MMPPVSIYDESSIFVVVRQMTFVLIFVLFWWDLKRGMFLAEKAYHLSYIIIWVGLILEEILNHQGHEGAQGKTL
jgi:hypothetical protein